jgi:hypothetical protein
MARAKDWHRLATEMPLIGMVWLRPTAAPFTPMLAHFDGARFRTFISDGTVWELQASDYSGWQLVLNPYGTVY